MTRLVVDNSLVPVSYVIFRRGSEVLLQLRRATGYMDGFWATAAAGHVEAGESAVDAACREVLEEIGISVEASNLVPLTTMHRPRAGGPGRVDFFFICRAWTGTPAIVTFEQ